MKPKEKAFDLYNKFIVNTPYQYAKGCALICVDEMDLIYQKLTPKDDPYCFLFEMEYLHEVKQEIKKL